VGGLVERLAASHDAVCVLDPEGDYGVLGQVPGARVIAVQRDEHWSDVLEALTWSTPVVADLSGVPHAAQVALVGTGLARLQRSRERHGLPHWIVVDEAHYLFHGAGVPAERAGLDAKGMCLVTYRARWLPPAVVDAMDVFVVGRTTDTEELAFLARVLDERGMNGRVVTEAGRDLEVGSFVIARPGRPPATFVPPPRAIRHIRHLTKYADHGVAPHHRFFFRGPDGGVVGSAGTLEDFLERLGEMAPPTLAHHARNGDFSRWIRDVFQEDLLADRVAKLERRWHRGEVADLAGAVRALIQGAFAGSS
jgi:hypothetical protein